MERWFVKPKYWWEWMKTQQIQPSLGHLWVMIWSFLVGNKSLDLPGPHGWEPRRSAGELVQHARRVVEAGVFLCAILLGWSKTSTTGVAAEVFHLISWQIKKSTGVHLMVDLMLSLNSFLSTKAYLALQCPPRIWYDWRIFNRRVVFRKTCLHSTSRCSTKFPQNSKSTSHFSTTCHFTFFSPCLHLPQSPKKPLVASKNATRWGSNWTMASSPGGAPAPTARRTVSWSWSRRPGSLEIGRVDDLVVFWGWNMLKPKETMGKRLNRCAKLGLTDWSFGRKIGQRASSHAWSVLPISSTRGVLRVKSPVGMRSVCFGEKPRIQISVEIDSPSSAQKKGKGFCRSIFGQDPWDLLMPSESELECLGHFKDDLVI